MAGTAVPQPTFGPLGFIVPSTPAVLAGVQADWNAAFNNTLNYQLTTPQGQLASSETAVIVNNYQIFAFYTQQIDPAYATGRMQDAICRFYFLQRDPGAPTTLQVTCTGAANLPIPINATVQDTAQNLYYS